MKKGRLYNREEIEVISKSSIGKTVNDILNEEVITIEDKEANKGGLSMAQWLLIFLGIGILLTLCSSLASMISIQKFSPLTILKERS